MLGYLLGITLVLTALFPFVFEDVFADSILVDFDKSLYKTGDLLTVTGEILDFGMPIIAMSIYDPDGKILSAHNLDISEQKTFSKIISLDSPFYEKSGEYKVKLDYGKISENYIFEIKSDSSEPETFEEPQEPEIILLYTEKKQYNDKDVIKITGLVSALDSPTVLIGIYDPFGMPGGFYFGTVDSNLEFSTSFLVKSGVNFRIDGTYSIKAHYADSEAMSFFDYYEFPQPITEEIFDDISGDESESSDEIISETVNDSSEEKTTDKDTQNNENNSVDEKIIETSQKDIVLQDTNKTPKIKETKLTKQKTDSKKSLPKTETKQTNLTVEDIELGKLLNQINLKCDSSILTDTISYYDGMGPALYRLCDFDGSLSFFNDSLVDNPYNVEILVNKGSALGKLGYFTEAVVYYDQAINIDPDFLPAKNNKANALVNLGNSNDAISLYNEVLEKNPNYITAKNNLALIQPESSQIHNVVDAIEEIETENIVFQKSYVSNEPVTREFKKQKPSSFLDEMSLAFSSLSSLFGFLN